jgi:isoquinoline 1-oxidoreductase subunit alpha
VQETKTNCIWRGLNVKFTREFGEKRAHEARRADEDHEGAHAMDAIAITVNGKQHSVEVSADTPLLWVLRDTLGLTGTKFGCGQALCGACTVHVDGEATRSCTTRIAAVAGHNITTIEGLSSDGHHPLQVAWVENQVPQCGYCQVGIIMTSAALLAKNNAPSDADIDDALGGHICRCGTYQRIRQAIHQAASGSRTPAKSASSGLSKDSAVCEQNTKDLHGTESATGGIDKNTFETRAVAGGTR